jgi:N-acetylglucosamine-6-sulfatase
VHDEQDGQPTTYSYSVWCTGERELYDLVTDPHQVRNLLAPLNSLGPFASLSSDILPSHTQKLLDRLDALLLVLKTCTGEVCHRPYSALFPDISATGGEIFNLSQALDERYDAYFASLPKVQYSKCELGYQARLEKPDWHDRLAYRGKHVRNGFVVQV